MSVDFAPIEEMLQLALSATVLEDETLDSIERYTTLLEEALGKLDAEGRHNPRLEKVLELHQELLNRLVREVDQVSDDRRALRARFKAIVSYLDVLPRKLSTTKTRKG